VSVLDDIANMLQSLLLSTVLIGKTISSSEVGPLDSKTMADYSRSLLMLQGNYYAAGYLYEQDWATQQRLMLEGLVMGGLAEAAAGGRAVAAETAGGVGAAKGGASAPVTNIQGTTRAAANSSNWSSGSLSETVHRIVGPNPEITYTASGKTVYTNPTTNMTVVYDNAGNYYRVQNAVGQYLDKSGNVIPNNVPLIGPNKTTQTGVPKDIRQGLTHFTNTDPIK
jgi:hypothetical protein